MRWLTCRPMQNIPLLCLHGLPSKYASGHCPAALWRIIQKVLKHLGKSKQIMYPYALHSSSWHFCQLSHHQWYKGTSSIGRYACPWHKMKWYASDHEQFLPFSILFLSFWFKLIFVSSLYRILFQNCTVFFRRYFWQTLIWFTWFLGLPKFYIL